MPELVAASCPCCSGGMSPTQQFRPHPYLSCPFCGYVGYSAQSSSELSKLYDDEYFATTVDVSDREARGREAANRVRWLAANAPARGRVLEIGSSEGSFVEAARAEGFDAEGLEPNDAVAASARSRSVPVTTGVIEDFDTVPGSWDAVAAWHVIEHLAAPAEELRRVAEWLRPGGQLFIEVPNVASVAARASAADWYWLDPEHHISQFTPRALRRLLHHVGFGDVRTSSVTYDSYEAGIASWLEPRQLWNHLGYYRWTGAHPLRPHRDKHDLLRCTARRVR